LCTALAAKIPADVRAEVTAVVAPAMGGLICGYELARALGVTSMFVERPQGVFELRRGFRLTPRQKVLMMEDVVTTGLSSREAIKAIEDAGGTVIHAASLVDRSNGKADLGVPFTPLIRLDVPSYAADALPPELAAIPAVKPGSRAA
jgi:orotate phosphoribosyltransferase